MPLAAAVVRGYGRIKFEFDDAELAHVLKKGSL